MATLSAGGVGAASAVALMATERAAGLLFAFVAFALIGCGVSACGTSLLALLAKRVEASRRAAAATLVWLMMIAGFAVTAGICGRLLEPYSPARLVAVSAAVSALACLVTLCALAGLEGAAVSSASPAGRAPALPFRRALADAWADPAARRFTVFVFVSMLAYSAQDLVLEPFAGAVFGFTPGQSTALAGVQHGGVLVGMLLAAAAGVRLRGRDLGSLTGWTVAGCVASALALAGLVASAWVGPAWPFRATVFVLGAANGVFSIAAIGSMMRLAGQGRERREGVRMGLWGAAQAVAFGLGGIVGTGASDLARWLLETPALAYAAVFALEAVLFLVAARLALRATSAPRNAMGTGIRSLREGHGTT
jgi:BCD family chlorophyll transporter-like MFS transporter